MRVLSRESWRGSFRGYGFEPSPEWLRPWPSCPGPLLRWTPWWDQEPGDWQLADRTNWTGRILESRFQESSLTPQPQADWVFLDLFSPGRHPEDWSEELFAALNHWTGPDSVLTSYCCARLVRDALSEKGWYARRLRRKGLRDTLIATRLP